MAEIAGILFDFDGTLTAPEALDFGLLRAAVGCPPGEPILEFLATLPPAEQAAANQRLHAAELAQAHLAQPNQGAVPLLAWLAERHWPLAILTRNTEAAVRASLANFPPWVAPLFQVIVSRDSAVAPKPSPAGVWLAAEQMGLPAAALLVVGDFRYDMEAGQAAGAHTAYLRNGEEPEEPLSRPPDFVLETLADLPAILPARPVRICLSPVNG